MMRTRFTNRRDAGRRLAEKLEQYRNAEGVIVLGLPRGGVPVAFEVASALDAPLDVFMVRKLGLPGHEELAMGALASGGARVMNTRLVEQLRVPRAAIDAVVAREQRELARRQAEFRGHRPFPELAGSTVILVDDGIATGSTMAAAVAALREKQPAAIVVAVPVAAAETRAELLPRVDDFVSVITPLALDGVSAWYDDFRQTSDAEVHACLQAATVAESPGSAAGRHA